MLRRLRSVLVGLVIVALSAGIWLFAANTVRDADRPSVAAHRAEMVAEIRLAAAALNNWFSQSRAQLTHARSLLDRSLGPWSGSSAQVARARPLLDSALPPGSNLDGGLIIVDRQSQVVATASALAALDRQPRPSWAVTSALDGADGAGDVALETITETDFHYVALTTPLTNSQGAVTGALVGFTVVPSGTLSAVVAALDDALGRPVAVVTAGGTVVPPSTDPTLLIRRVDAGLAPAVAEAPAGAHHLAYRGEAGEPTVAAVAPLMVEHWAVVAPQPASAVAVTGERATTAASAALAGVLAVTTAIIIGLLALLRARTANLEEAKQSFLAIAGHELRTPLTVMKGYTDLLVERWEDVPDESRHGIIETVSYQVRNLEHLVERLLFGAQLEAGIALSTTPDEVELSPIMEEIAAHQRGIAPAHSFVVHSPHGLRARADAKALEHILTNLVENAVKYSPDGGAVTMTAEERRGRVQLTVEDEGIGLPTDLEGIFDKFVQREAVDTRVHDEGGVGLGLYIVRTLVQQMGGSVRAAHRSPKGATFIVTLRATS